MSFDQRINAFITGSETILARYKESLPVAPLHSWCGKPYWTSFGERLKAIYGPKYVKIQGMHPDDLGFIRTFAVIEIDTGNVYRPSSSMSGSINKKTAKIKGNIHDEDYGLKNVDYNGPRADYAKNKHKKPYELDPSILQSVSTSMNLGVSTSTKLPSQS